MAAQVVSIALLKRLARIKEENGARVAGPGLTRYRCECCGPIFLNEDGDGAILVCPACNEDAHEGRGNGHVREFGLCLLMPEPI